MTVLDVYLEAAREPIGKLRSGPDGEMSFTYVTADLPHPVSASLPVREEPFDDVTHEMSFRIGAARMADDVTAPDLDLFLKAIGARGFGRPQQRRCADMVIPPLMKPQPCRARPASAFPMSFASRRIICRATPVSASRCRISTTCR